MPGTRITDIEKLRVLVVEDEPVILMDIATMASQCGCCVITARSLKGAEQIEAKYSFNVALLDVRLQDTEVFPLAERLESRHVPIAFISGHSAIIIVERAFGHRPRISKPFTQDDIETLLRKLMKEL
jgi:CheY-like chemotaxis protein